jgi:glycosyltransferase involved in cell wall biosynthesis
MKILHLHDSPRIAGGATGYLSQLVAALEARGHEGALFSLEGEAGWLPQERSYCYPWAGSALRRRRDFHHHHAPLAAALGAFLEEAAPDLVHVQNWGVFRSTVFPLLAASGLPVVMTVHDFTLLDPNPWGLRREGWSSGIRRWLDRRSLERARAAVFQAVDRFLCPSEALRSGIPFPAGSARLLRLPLAPTPAPPLPGGPPRLLFAGTLYRSKGVDLLLEALSRVAPPLELDIAGQGDQEETLMARATELGLGPRVRFLGQLDAGGMAAAYAGCHAVVLASRVAENSPYLLLEGGLRGRPGIAPDRGGCPEILDPPRRGWTFRSEDPDDLARILEEVARSPEERTRRGAAARDWVARECDPAAHWDAVDSLYRDLLR